MTGREGGAGEGGVLERLNPNLSEPKRGAPSRSNGNLRIGRGERVL